MIDIKSSVSKVDKCKALANVNFLKLKCFANYRSCASEVYLWSHSKQVATDYIAGHCILLV